jgi:three-Cys-motif partner protein
MTDHRFGGIWTEVKLGVIDAYAKAYTTALSNQKFSLWYIDAFAGTGSRTTTKQVGGLLDGVPVEDVDEILEGSARRALAVTPPFDHLRLIERRRDHFSALSSLRDEFADRDVLPLFGDANSVLPRIFGNPPWTAGPDSWKQRSLVFLDPYGVSVKWETLQLLANTGRADIWYLVNLKGVCQQMPRAHGRLDPGKRAMLDAFFGGADWEDQFYSFEPSRQLNMLDELASQDASRSVTREKLGAFYRQRLHEKLFEYVSDPISLRVRSADDYFHLYLMSNNKSERAQRLIKAIASSIIRKHSLASHRTSDL